MEIFGRINKISKFHNDLLSDEKYYRKNTRWITFFLIKYSAHLLLLKENKKVNERHGKKLWSCTLKNKLEMVFWKKMQNTITNMSRWDFLSSEIEKKQTDIALFTFTINFIKVDGKQFGINGKRLKVKLFNRG